MRVLWWVGVPDFLVRELDGFILQLPARTIEIRDAGPTSVQEVWGLRGKQVPVHSMYSNYDYIRYLHLSSTRTRNVGYVHQSYA